MVEWVVALEVTLILTNQTIKKTAKELKEASVHQEAAYDKEVS